MSTTINPVELPDVKALEKLANEFFTAVPGALSNYDFEDQATNPGALSQHSLLNQGNVTNINQPPTSLPDPHFHERNLIPHSVAGSGISPSGVDKGSAFNITNPQTSLPDPHFAGQGVVPRSVAGSGISPSVAEHGKTFNVNNPQTSLPDPHFEHDGANKSQEISRNRPSGIQDSNRKHNLPDTLIPGHGLLPTSFSGSGISPSAVLTHIAAGTHPHYSSYLPLQPQQPFEAELREVLNALHSSVPGPQFPNADSSIISPSFYFVGSERLKPSEGGNGLTAQYLSAKESGFGFGKPGLDVNLIKRDFPILQERVNGKPIIWLDNAATTQKPKQVIDRISYFYEHENSNIHRAAHELAARATDAYENARKKVQLFLNAGSVNEIIFVRGATEAINLIAKSWGEQYLNEGDEIIVSHLEHHANIVPWQQLAAKKGLKIRVIPVDDDGQVLLDEFSRLLGPRTKLVAFTQVSNALGTVTPAKQMVEMAHHAGAKVLVDGAQSVSHMRVDVQQLNCDWFVFSGHKVFGPTGIGVVYGKEALLNETQPWQGGGNMIVDVTFEHTKYHNSPGRFEAGTGNIADAVGLGAAIDYVSRIGMDLINQYEHYLLLYATRLMKDVPGLRMIGTAKDKASVLSFVLEGFRTEEVGVALNQEGIAVRAGHHCAQPILRRFGVESTVRPSLAFYNTCADIDALVNTLLRLRSGRGGNLKA